MALDTDITFEGRDEFNRKSIAEKAIKLLRSDISVSPLVVDGSWGLGKTEFCLKMINLMKIEDTHHLIYIDAFKADHADEPLLTVLTNVLAVLPENKQRTLIKKAMPALRYGLKVGGKALVSHLLRQDVDSVAENLEKEIKQVTDKAIDASIESLLKDHAKAEKNLQALQGALKSIAHEKPMILFMDELDRCRPDFAVLMLETVKHTFDIEGLQFVLITNTDQLKASINHCYGRTIDAQRYLDKFLKFTFTLPSTKNESGGESVSASVFHYKKLLNKSETLKDLPLNRVHFFDLVKQVIKINHLSLREVETLARHIEIYQTLSDKESRLNGYGLIVSLLSLVGILLVSCKPNLANAALREELDAKELGHFLGLDNLPVFNDGETEPSVLDIITVILGPECKHNNQHFVCHEDEQKKYWDSQIRSFYPIQHPTVQKEQRLKIVIDAIKAIYLMT